MAFASALSSVFPAAKARLARGAALAAALALTGCIGNSVYDDLNSTQPVGSVFAVALFKDYSYLARSFGTQSEPPGEAFDAEGAISLTDTDNSVSGLANAYGQKALLAAKGEEVLPEPAPDGDADAENVRLELLRDLDDGRDKAPEDAARAQADYDCWVMNRRVDSLASAAASCRRSVTRSLVRLERELNPTPTAAPTEAPVAPPPAPVAAAQPAEFTVTFAARSAAIAPEALATISQAIAAARSGRQGHITVVGHSDSAENSQKLALRRAEAVKNALVLQGARAEAVEAKAAGKDETASADRNAVITLVP